jgi:hypothetical protein
MACLNSIIFNNFKKYYFKKIGAKKVGRNPPNGGVRVHIRMMIVEVEATK